MRVLKLGETSIYGHLPRRLFVAFALLAALTVSANPAVVSDKEAAKYVGETVSVRGVVAGVYTSRSNTTFVNFGKPFPHHTFTAVIFSGASARFKDPGKWEGKVITVTGRIKLYKGKPEMVLDDSAQVSE